MSKYRELEVLTTELLPGDIVDHGHDRFYTVKEVEVVHPPCVVAKISTTGYDRFFWAGINGVQRIRRPQP